MNINAKIYLAGHNGMVGSALQRKLIEAGYLNIITRSSSELDLLNQKETFDFLQYEKPEYVLIAAAKVGGIYANDIYPADFIYQNLMIQANLIHGSYLAKINRLLFLGSSCIYPKESKQPIKEKYLLSGYLEITNEPYAIAKISGIKLCESYNRQYDTDYRSVMPTNLYGPNDNFHSKNSHVIPALIQRFHKAKVKNEPLVSVWGSGKQMRDFLHVDDAAAALILIMKLSKKNIQKEISPNLSHINIGSGQDISIRDVAIMVKKIVGFEGEIVFNNQMPDGTLKKRLDISKIKRLGWKPSISLEEGLRETYLWFLSNNQLG